jgi:hypothetical protein
MLELNPLISISKEIRSWSEYNKNISSDKKKELKKSITALSIAILKTKSYLNNKNKNLSKENEIWVFWNNAHIELQNIDPELASRCFTKAEYWVEPEKWNNKKINQYNITLDSMSESLKTINN